MKGYLSVLTVEFKKSWRYRNAAFASIPLFFLRGLLSIAMIWAFNRVSHHDPQQLINYFWLVNLFYPVVSAWVVDYDLNTIIKSGNVAYEYVKPLSIYESWFMRVTGQRLAQLWLSSLPILLVIGFLPVEFRFHLEMSPQKILPLILTIILALFLNVSLSLLVYVSVFYTYSVVGSLLVFGSIMEFTGGTVIPFSLFPHCWQQVFKLFPFWYGSAFPFQYATGQLNSYHLISGILLQVVWILIAVMIGKRWLHHQMHRIEIQGG